jgi:hypothetical protein
MATWKRIAYADEVLPVTITSVEQGDIIYRNSSEWVNLHHGTDGQALITKGNAANLPPPIPRTGCSGGIQMTMVGMQTIRLISL